MRILLKQLILVGALLIGTSAYADYRIATVDLGRVFTNYWKTKQAQIALDEKKSDFEKAEKEKAATYNKAKDDYQKLYDSMSDPAVSAQERDKRKKALDDKVRDIKDQEQAIGEFERYWQTQLQEQFKRAHDGIVTDIRTAVSAKSKADGYALVIDTAAQSVNGTPVILYSVPGDNDITDAVIKQLNAGAPVDITSTDKPAAKPDDKAAPKPNDKLK